MRHYEEPVVAHCRTCTRPYCSRCLVYSFGPDKPPFCVGCALAASGVRNKNKPIPVAAQAAAGPDRRAERAQRKAEKAEAKANARAMKRAAKQGDAVPAVEAPRTSNVPVPKGLPTPSARFAPQPESAVS
jgi:hypothetical protein